MSMVCRLTAVDSSGFKRVVEEPDRVFDILFPEEDDESILDIDKSWHALQFALTGTAWEGEWPSSFLVDGGTVIGLEEDWGYGQPRAFTPAEVREIAAFIDTLPASVLRTRFDAHVMEQLELYPSGWASETEWEYFVEHFERMQAFLRDAAADGKCVVVSLS